MNARRMCLVVAVAVLTVPAVCTAAPDRSVPIIYTTDLYHPHNDPDDHFDLATLFALPELDLRAIIFDMGPDGAGHAGVVPLQQMMHLTGRTVPYAAGLTANLDALEDKAEAQPPEAQAGVALILDTLTRADGPVTVITAGSLRDVAAAYNRAPDLFAAKVARLYVNAGHAGGEEEWNVKLDPRAFVRILKSPLPIYWAPCFGPSGFQTLYTFKQGDVLEAAPEPLQQFFLYALAKTDPATEDPLAALTKPVAQDARGPVWEQKRNMWCTGTFLHAAGRTEGPFEFRKMPVRVTEDGRTSFVTEGDCVFLQTFHTQVVIAYRAFMTGAVRSLYAAMPLVVKTEAPTPDQP